MPEKSHIAHIQRLWALLEQSAGRRALADVIFYAGRLVDNYIVQPPLPVIPFEEVEPPAPTGF